MQGTLVESEHLLTWCRSLAIISIIGYRIMSSRWAVLITIKHANVREHTIPTCVSYIWGMGNFANWSTSLEAPTHCIWRRKVQFKCKECRGLEWIRCGRFWLDGYSIDEVSRVLEVLIVSRQVVMRLIPIIWAMTRMVLRHEWSQGVPWVCGGRGG